MTYNDFQLLPYFFMNYDDLDPKYYFYDWGSDSKSLELIKSHPNTEIISDFPHETLDDNILMNLKNTVWKKSRGVTDWVIVSDLDEFLYHPRLKELLEILTREKYTIIKPVGYDMTSEEVPSNPNEFIIKQINCGLMNHLMDKYICFNPNLIQEINFRPGCHTALPIGEIKYYFHPMMKLLHMKYLGLGYLMERRESMASRLSEYNKQTGFASYSLNTPEEMKIEFMEAVERSKKIF
jgi:hypothetical protein